MTRQQSQETPGPAATGIQRLRTLVMRRSTPVIIAAIVGFVLWAHFGSGVHTFRSEVSIEPGWEAFRTRYDIAYFGEDGQFVRAVQNGYNLVYHTHKHAARFTRKSAADPRNACAGCHTAEDLAYSFVNSDRFDAKLGRRMSFEDQIRRCYAGAMDGFAPTIYDPAVRDIRLFARAVAHHLQLGEGALAGGQSVQRVAGSEPHRDGAAMKSDALAERIRP